MLTCMMTNSTQWAYYKTLKPKGIIIHSSGRNNPYLRHFVQPSKNDENYEDIISQLGENKRHDDWNHIHTAYNFHYWIGKDNFDNVVSIQTFPLDVKTWKDSYIHICICEDNLDNPTYLTNCISKLIKLCKSLCDQYNWNEDDIYDYSEISNFPDTNYWLEKCGYNIKLLRSEIMKKIDK